MQRRRLLSFAVATGRVAYACFIGEKLADWGLSYLAYRSPEVAAAQAQRWINRFRPDVVVTEKHHSGSPKGEHSWEIIGAIERTANHNPVFAIEIVRTYDYPNRYEEAAALAERFPVLSDWVPAKPPIWEAEAPNIICFEAISLAVKIIDRPEVAV